MRGRGRGEEGGCPERRVGGKSLKVFEAYFPCICEAPVKKKRNRGGEEEKHKSGMQSEMGGWVSGVRCAEASKSGNLARGLSEGGDKKKQPGTIGPGKSKGVP